MSLKLKYFSVLSAVFLLSFQVSYQQVALSPKRDIIMTANNLVREYNKGTAHTSRVIKVVYFHGKAN